MKEGNIFFRSFFYIFSYVFFLLLIGNLFQFWARGSLGDYRITLSGLKYEFDLLPTMEWDKYFTILGLRPQNVIAGFYYDIPNIQIVFDEVGVGASQNVNLSSFQTWMDVVNNFFALCGNVIRTLVYVLSLINLNILNFFISLCLYLVNLMTWFIHFIGYLVTGSHDVVWSYRAN